MYFIQQQTNIQSQKNVVFNLMYNVSFKKTLVLQVDLTDQRHKSSFRLNVKRSTGGCGVGGGWKEEHLSHSTAL